MGSLGRSPSGLDLTIGVPGSSSSSSSSSPVWSGRLSFCSSLSSVAVDSASSTVFSSSFLDVLGPYIAAGGGGGSMRDLDINQPAYGGEEDYPMGSVEEEEEEGGTPRPKKLRLSKEQSRLLEESFTQHHTLNPKQKEALAMKLELRPRQVEVWFQNRRARTKLKHTEMECEFLKRCFGSLTQENRRLQREVEELRALRVAPPTVLSPHTRQPLPASSLTMCPRCERVTAAPHLAPSSAGRHPFHRPATLPFAGIADG